MVLKIWKEILRGVDRLLAFIGKSWLHFFAAVQCVLLLALACYWLWGVIHARPAQKFSKDSLPVAPVEVQKVHADKFEQKSILAGSLQAAKHVVLKTAIEGHLKKIFATPGKKVKKGETLFLFDDALYSADMGEASAKLAMAEARYKRDISLGKKAARSAKDVEESGGQVSIQQASLNKSKAMLERATVKAPFDGIVGIHSLTEGAYLKPGDELVALSQASDLDVDFCVPERHLDALKKGDEVTFSVDSAEDKLFTAVIDHIDVQAHPVRHCVRCRARVEEMPGVDILRHGLYARVQVVTRVNEGVVLVPQSAIEARGTSNYVYVMADNKAHHRNVKVGGRSGDHVEVISGLSPGDVVIVAGQIRIQDGFPVFVVPPKVLNA